MTIRSDGTANCDRCGVDIGNAGINQCAVINVLTGDGSRVESLHLCAKGVPGGEGCESRVLTKAALAWYVSNVGDEGETPRFFTFTPPPS